jgi:hypothetical protein
LARLLDGGGLLNPGDGAAATLQGYTSASGAALATAFSSLLGLAPPVREATI